MSEYKYKEKVKSEVDKEVHSFEQYKINAELDEVYVKAEAFDEIKEYFESVVTEDGNVYEKDENIIVKIQNIIMEYNFESGDSDGTHKS